MRGLHTKVAISRHIMKVGRHRQTTIVLTTGMATKTKRMKQNNNTANRVQTGGVLGTGGFGSEMERVCFIARYMPYNNPAIL